MGAPDPGRGPAAGPDPQGSGAGTAYPGGTYVPDVVCRRRGPENAHELIVVVGGVADKPSRSIPDVDALDRGPFIGPREFVDRPRPPVRPMVTVNDRPYELPIGDPQALRDFVTMAYLAYGWPSVLAVRRELEEMHGLLMHPTARTHELNATPAKREALRVSGAALADTARWINGFADATTQLRLRVLHMARLLEAEAASIADSMLRRSSERVIDEMAHYFQWQDRAAASAALDALRAPRLQSRQQAVKNLKEALERLKPLAQQVRATNTAAGQTRARQRQQLGREQIGILNDAAVSHLKALDEAAFRARKNFAEALLREAPGAPVLYRFDVETVLSNPAELERAVFDRLRRSWRASQDLRERVRRSRPADRAEEKEVRKDTLPETLIAKETKGSVWEYEKVLRAAVSRLPAEERDLYERLLDSMRAAREGADLAEVRTGIARTAGLGMLTLALTVVCPPAGIALDLGLSVADIVEAASDYMDAADETVSDLDPRQCLSDVEPSSVGLVMAVAGGLLSVAL
ncbi:hypothetical protein [Streptomyces sp. NPDC093094]|uniref:hypothetical protein n=1 Tax=Streptomyces sp. NPDC093094 TaxID=3366026 RepID=UPI003826EAB6